MADLNLAISEDVVNRLFEAIRDSFSESSSNAGAFGAFTASYAAGVKLKHGKVEFQNNGTVLIKELDIVYDPLSIKFGVDIPPVTLGGFCIIPTPLGCALRAPEKTFFSGNPDISVTLDIGGIVSSEISASCSAKIKHFDDPDGAGMSRWDAIAADHANKWQVYLDPGYVDIDFIDIADTVGNLIDKLIDAAVDQLLGLLPDWAKDLIKTILGGFNKLIRNLLDIGDDVQEWLSNLLGVSLGLFDIIIHIIIEYLATKSPVFEFDDPYPLIPAQTEATPLVPVLTPIINPSIDINDKELIISASLGVL